jgi:hypothetical protein
VFAKGGEDGFVQQIGNILGVIECSRSCRALVCLLFVSWFPWKDALENAKTTVGALALFSQ